MAIRVLHVLNGLGSGGTEAFIMNVYRAIDREKVQFDFLVRSTENSAHEEEVRRLGGNIYVTPEFPRHFLKNKKAVKKFFQQHANEYSAVHVHANALMYVEPLKAAKKAGVKTVIVHSHSNQAVNPLYTILHAVNKKRIGKWITHSFACSKAAGEWMFNKSFTVVNNGINLKKFTFSQEKREEIRTALKIDDAFVIGHVGRFVPVKNHAFLLEIFEEVKKLRTGAKLLLVGDGELLKSVQESVKQKNLTDDVIFTGAVSNVQDYLQAMDVFLLPSKYEGAPVALIEGQASGLPCVVSENVPSDVALSDLVVSLSLETSPNEWAKSILEVSLKIVRQSRYKDFEEKGYAVESTAQFLQEIYLTEKE